MATYKHQRAEGPATVLAIGKAVPPTAYPQSEYSDFFFDITNTNEKTALKALAPKGSWKTKEFHNFLVGVMKTLKSSM